MRLAALPLLMAAVAASAGGIAMTALYDTALRQERAELLEMARAQRTLIEAVARFDSRYSSEDVGGGAVAATMSQLREAHETFAGFGRSGEFYFGRRAPDSIDYVVPLRFESDTDSKPLPDSDRVMQLALAGMTGTTVGPDYRGERVLAAYTPIPALGIGLVVKVDMAEIRAPFLSTALVIFLVIVILIAAGFAITRQISMPVARELDEKARLEIELEFARAVQANLLPASAPEIHALRCAALMEPARFVSGDFYDFVETDDETVAVIIGDVTGKGVSGRVTDGTHTHRTA